MKIEKLHEKVKHCPLIGAPCPEKMLDGCPMWVELDQVDNEGNSRKLCGCSAQMQVYLQVEVIKKSNQTAAAAESMRNEILREMPVHVLKFLGELKSHVKTIGPDRKAANRKRLIS